MNAYLALGSVVFGVVAVAAAFVAGWYARGPQVRLAEDDAEDARRELRDALERQRKAGELASVVTRYRTRLAREGVSLPGGSADADWDRLLQLADELAAASDQPAASGDGGRFEAVG